MDHIDYAPVVDRDGSFDYVLSGGVIERRRTAESMAASAYMRDATEPHVHTQKNNAVRTIAALLTQ